MNLLVQREPSSLGATYGKLFVDGVYECETLEDVVREISGQPVELWKIQNETAIPEGRYRVVLSDSVHFGGRLTPLLLEVPGFTGVRIHCGNDEFDTDGCLLVGTNRRTLTTAEGQTLPEIAICAPAYAVLFSKIQSAISAGQDVWITFANAG